MVQVASVFFFVVTVMLKSMRGKVSEEILIEKSGELGERSVDPIPSQVGGQCRD